MSCPQLALLKKPGETVTSRPRIPDEPKRKWNCSGSGPLFCAGRSPAPSKGAEQGWGDACGLLATGQRGQSCWTADARDVDGMRTSERPMLPRPLGRGGGSSCSYAPPPRCHSFRWPWRPSPATGRGPGSHAGRDSEGLSRISRSAVPGVGRGAGGRRPVGRPLPRWSVHSLS